MNCCKYNKNQKERVNNRLIFLRDELLQDIANYAFVSADIMPVEDEHLKHQVFDVTQDGNEELAIRILNLAHAESVELLYPYTKAPCILDEELNDKFAAPESYEIELSLPAEFSRTTVLLLRELIHDFLVCRVLLEWMGITNPSAQPFWRERLELLTQRMKSSLSGRRKPLRRKQSLF